MRSMRCVGAVAATAAALATGTAEATFHLMQIQQVIGGVNGDTTAQAIQLRFRDAGQCFLDPARLRVRDAAGLNPILLFDFSVCPAFPSQCVPGCAGGDTVLLVSPAMAAYLDPPITPDFILTNLIPAGYLAAGSLTFEDNVGTVYWRLSWGGAGYTGSNAGASDNDDSFPGNFGPPFPGALPSNSDQALLFHGPFTAESTTNAADYGATAGAAVFTNNLDQTTTVVRPNLCPWDFTGPKGTPDDTVGVNDLLDLLSAWGPNPGNPADFDGSGDVGIVDLLKLLANWGPCL